MLEISIQFLTFRILAITHTWTNYFITWPNLHAWTSEIGNISWSKMEVVISEPETQYGKYI